MGNVCPRCGHENRNGNRYCTQCGSRLPQSSQPYLIVIAGTEKGRRYDLVSRENRIGRSSQNEIIVKDPATSAFHAKITIEGGEAFIEDLDSTNGTILNGQRIRERMPLHPEYLIKIGSTLLKFMIDH